MSFKVLASVLGISLEKSHIYSGLMDTLPFLGAFSTSNSERITFCAVQSNAIILLLFHASGLCGFEFERYLLKTCNETNGWQEHISMPISKVSPQQRSLQTHFSFLHFLLKKTVTY